MPDRRQLSKFISLILRHRAGDFGIALDDQGFTDYERLRGVVAERSRESYSDEDWQAVIAAGTDGKKRFELRDGRIRALYGHSRVTPVQYEACVAPEILYHGTTPRALPAIRKGGLRSMKRQYVHLSASIETATRVAERRTETAVILAVHAGEAARSGVEFFHPEPELYLAKAVPSQYIDILEV